MDTGFRSRAVGWQCVLDLFDCRAPRIDDLGWIRRTLLEAAEAAAATVVSDSFHRFEPHGISGIVVIAESHLAIHTWPELHYAAIDVFTCNSEFHVERAVDYLIAAFDSPDAEIARFTRGDHRLEYAPIRSSRRILPTADATVPEPGPKS